MKELPLSNSFLKSSKLLEAGEKTTSSPSCNFSLRERRSSSKSLYGPKYEIPFSSKSFLKCSVALPRSKKMLLAFGASFARGEKSSSLSVPPVIRIGGFSKERIAAEVASGIVAALSL